MRRVGWGGEGMREGEWKGTRKALEYSILGGGHGVRRITFLQTVLLFYAFF